ncbi:hypothetical protein [Nocardioides sp. TF02-7]|uniref:hypothetical protein n=1 Tax=Nocardioides sp. TF02-7 TaxID=2917724 RepID=UPI001F05D523|nr:hypothetical protein [Nocardioides sp. TF02-7]UMG91004.1 hypothetical protein MF408_12240 [Nocardioides sp. TF02-7]
MPRLVVLLAWVVAGACWLGALFLPWTADGALSRSTLVEAVRLVRRGAVDAVVPQSAAVVLLLPAVAGIVLIGLGGFQGRAVGAARLVSALVGAVAVLALVLRLTSAAPAAAGPGAWVALAGVVAAVAAAVGTIVGLARFADTRTGNG